MGELEQETEVLVIGSGPGGYAAAFRAADLGLDVTMVDMSERPGGECLHRGCIPSKSLLFLAELLHDADRAKDMGITFGSPRIDLEMIRTWKEDVIHQLSEGLRVLGSKRSVQQIKGQAVFESSNRVRLQDSEVARIRFHHAILASGSYPSAYKGVTVHDGGRIMDSRGALELPDIPETLLILGGGYIALELGTVYASLGSRVTVAVRSDRLLRAADADLAAPLIARVKGIFEEILFNTEPASLVETRDGVEVIFEGTGDHRKQVFSRVLVAIGRKPNTETLGLENTGVTLDDRDFVVADEKQRTMDESIFAVGDVAGGPLLAHKAFRQGKVAAEVISGEPSAYDVRAVPAVVYTDPQVSWCGLTEDEARKKAMTIRVERFPWRFSSRAVTMGAEEGMTKMIFDPETERILGMGITGRHTEGMISEGVLAVEMGALAQDLALSVHPHPTLSETIGEAADIFLGSVTHMLPKKK
jgi:dihydrolipoamide dehydrogenase